VYFIVCIPEHHAPASLKLHVFMPKRMIVRGIPEHHAPASLKQSKQSHTYEALGSVFRSIMLRPH